MKNNNQTKLDYSKQERQFMTFGYSSPTDGMYLIDDVEYQVGKDFRTLEHYLEYKECGLNTMMLQSYFAYEGKEPWEESLAKRMMDLCLQAGIKKCIITDRRLHQMSASSESLVGEGKRFATQEDLNAYVATCMEDYVKHPAFLGLLINDEPRHWTLPAFGQIYRAIKAYCPDAYIEANLLPYMTYCQVRDFYCDHEEGVDLEEGYERYMKKFCDCSGADKLLTDDYPFMADRIPFRMLDEHIRCVQIIADYCAAHNLRFEAVAQTFSGSANGGKNPWWAPQTFDTMQWQLNLYLAMGVKVFSYFTYWRKQCNRRDGEWYYNGTSFMTQEGEKTSLWYVMKEIHEEMQKFAPTMYDFKYRASTYIVGEDATKELYYFKNVKQEELEIIDWKKVTCNEDAIVVLTELVNEETGDHMIAVMNANNPYLATTGRDVDTNFEIDFGKEFKGLTVHYRGESRVVNLEDGKYRGHLKAGYAEYLIPFKK
ncbi:MAG: hypothetical protein MJ239_04075 [Bacilli bacterium]|nr:hypothetical protein [Bacilli bacterium]